MNSLSGLRQVLRDFATEVEVLPAVGGAVEDLERPDFEEKEDQAINSQEKIFNSVFEKDPTGESLQLYRQVSPLRRSEEHFFRFFLDGSFRSYFLGTALENERESPIHFAQIGACILKREDNGLVKKEILKVENILLAGKQRLSESVWRRLEELTETSGLKLVDLTEKDIVSGVLGDFDLRNKAGGKVRFEMRKLEISLITEMLPKLPEGSWLIADGSLIFEPLLGNLLKEGTIKPVIGVSKNFRKDPQFVFGKGPRAERLSIFKLLAGLNSGFRTTAFSAQEGKVIFWYVRLREQKYMDYPLMGVVKVELANPSREPISSEIIDKISSALLAEKEVTPHGQDTRWHAHLYPIFLAERMVKESLLRREVIQQYLKWR